MTDFLTGAGQPLLAGLFFLLAMWLLLGRRFNLPMPGRRASAGASAPPARLAAAVLPLQAPITGDKKMSNLTAAWIAKGTASTLDRPTVQTASPVPVTEPSAPPVSSGVVGRNVQAGELTRWGQQAARAGDRQVAYRLFIRATEHAPSNEEAWIWRAATCEQAEEAIRCLEQVLRINPNNHRAQQGLSESRRRLAGL